MKSKTRIMRLAILVAAAFFSQACVGKFLSSMLSNENANFKIIEAKPLSNTKIIVSFNKILNYEKGALTLANYSIPGLNLASVTKGPETNQVYLLLNADDSTRMIKKEYTLSVESMQNQYLEDLLPGAENRSITFTGSRWLRATCNNDAGTYTCPTSSTASGSAFNVTVRGDYAKGKNYRWRLHNLTTSLDHIAQSAITGIDQTFTVPAGLPSADYRLDILIQDSDGAWQPVSDESKFYFSVDSTPPSNIGLLNVPTSPTNISVTNFSVVYRDNANFGAPNYSASSPDAQQIPAFYKYRVRFNAGGWGAWTGAINVNTPVNYIPASGNGTYDIQVVASDTVGNWQCDTSLADATPNNCLGTQTITAFFTAKPHQISTFVWDTVAPTATLNTPLPANPTSATSFSIQVSAAGISRYQYRIIGSGFSGLWSTDKDPAIDLISGAGLLAGTYQVDVIGKDTAGNYQSTSTPTTHIWVVDLTAPTATLATQGSCTGTPGVTTNGLPTSPTRFNCYNIKVNNLAGAMPRFRYAPLQTGTSCPTLFASYSNGPFDPTGNFIAANNVAMVNGTTYSICVIGSNDNVLWQGTSASAVTRHTFTYDTSPPVSTVVSWLNPASNLSGKNTILTDVSVLIGNSGGEDVIAYKGGVYATANCTAVPGLAAIQALPEQSVYTPLQATGLAAGATRICYIGRDVAGNYETAVQSTAFTIFTPAAPTDGGGVLDTTFANTFNFSWAGIPADTTEIRIQVCNDPTCTNPLPTMSNGIQVCNDAPSCLLATSYPMNTLCAGLGCIKPLNGANYYARLKVIDSVGAQSNFNANISNGKTVVGGITGIVRDTNNNPVTGATVRLYQSGCAVQIGANIVTPASGAFTFTSAAHAVPISTSASGFCVTATTAAPAFGEKRLINVDAAVNTDIGSLYVVNTTGRGCMIGSLVDGSTGSQLLLSNATFTLKDYTGAAVSGAPNLDPDGKQFAFPSGCVTNWNAAPYTSPTYYYTGDPGCTLATGNCLTSGIYSLDVSLPGYYSISETAIGVTANSAIHTGYLPMVGTFAAGSKQIKVIATWGTGAKDLDLHVVGPASNAFDCQPYNEAAIQNANGALSKFHIYFLQKYCAETGTSAPAGSINLAVDDTYEYGPEIINFQDVFVDGTYKFSLFNNDTVAPNWNISKARIYVYAGNHYTGGGGLIKVIYNSTASTLRAWKPFRMLVNGTALTIDDNSGATFGYANLTYGLPGFAACTGTEINGSSDGLTVGGAVSGVAPADPNLDCGLYINGTTAASGAGPLDW